MQLLHKQTNTGTCTTLTAETNRYTTTRLRALSLFCDISIGSLGLPAPEAGDFVELIPLYTRSTQIYMLFWSTYHIAVDCLVNAPLWSSTNHYKTRSSAAYPILIVNCSLNAPLQAATQCTNTDICGTRHPVWDSLLNALLVATLPSTRTLSSVVHTILLKAAYWIRR